MGCCKKKPILDKLKSIKEGWENVIWPDPEVEKIATERIEICAKCNQNEGNWCTDCNCYIPAKARSLSEECILWDHIDKKYDL